MRRQPFVLCGYLVPLFSACLLLFFISGALDAQDKRAALVVGNSAYTSNSLANPVNDATDMAAALKEAGFEVILRTDVDLAGIERALEDFQTLLGGKDTALFYYAGHGVQVQGENYLIPVKEDIQSEANARSRGVALADVLDRIKASKVRTALIFLDACRDNPFPGSSRSGTRGLSVVSAPADVETLIAYATEPGSVAADGTGRNGVFTAAMLSNMAKPGQSIGDMMIQVRADVMAQTGGRQKPRADVGLSKPFYFNDPAVLAARAQAALDKSRAEIADLERQLADRQARINATRDTSAKQALEVEQQRQQALQTAKKLEADNLEREAERQKQAAAAAQELALRKQAADQAARQQQSELGNLAAARRTELEKLAQAGASDNPDVLIETVERLEAVLKEVDGQYAAALEKSLRAVNATWDMQLAAISKQEPDITETDKEFETRIVKEKSALESNRQAELSKLRADAESQRISQTAAIRQQFNDTLRTLESRTWTITGSAVGLTIGTFDRNARTWPFTVASNENTVPMLPVDLVAKLGDAADPVAAIKALDTAVKAKALTAELDWGITRDVSNNRYVLNIRTARVKNLTTNAVVVQAYPNQRAAYFAAGKRGSPTPTVGTIAISTDAYDGAAEVYVDGMKIGTTPVTAKRPEGTVNLEIRWADDYGKHFTQSVTVSAGQTATIRASKPVIRVGGTGPAGGIVFYDKGSVSDGWRYLEAAPTETSDSIPWYNGKYISIKTGTAVGSGKTNTADIVAAQGAGSYAARLCQDLVSGGFDDWFLPSQDELDLMYKNLMKANLGGFASAWYWSSSEYKNSDGNAVYQYFGNGNQRLDYKANCSRVRAIRAF